MKGYSIYSIRNKLNGKRYIGLSYKPLKRMEHHCKSIYPIGNAIRKYGQDNFDKRILKTGLTLKQAQKAERFYIAKYKSLSPNGYNLRPGGNTRGTFVTTEITKERLSRAAKISQNTLKRKKQLRASAIKQVANTHNMPIEEWKAINKLETRVCACGCNTKFKCKIRSKQKFIHGHNKNRLNKKHSKITREKISRNSGMHNKAIIYKKVASQLGISIKEYKQLIKIEIRICACGCKQTFECENRSSKRFISGHNDNGCYIPRELRTCACGCKQTFECLENSVKKFIHGHNARKAAFARRRK